jgi:membrane protein implicated in regulation of membrane protease activity
MSGGTAIVVWIVAAVVLLGAETLTLAFVAVYLAAGAIGAAIAAAAGANVGVQIVVFAVIAVLSLLLTRRPLKRMLDRTPLVQSNAQTVVGRHAVVTIAVPAAAGSRGQVRIGTEYWSARRDDDAGPGLEEGANVEVLALEGVTAIVRSL